MKSNVAVRVAENVRVELGRRNLAKTTLVPVLGVSYTAVQRRLTGELPMDIVELDALAAFFSVPLTTLLAGVPTLDALADDREVAS